MNDLTYLINPSERDILADAGDRPPLGLLYLAKKLEENDHKVKVFDLNHDDEGKLLMDVLKTEPNMIGVSCLTSPMVVESKRLLNNLRVYSPDSRLVVGGYHPTVCPEDFRNYADHVVRGEGEYALRCLVNNINGFITEGRPADLKALGAPRRDKLNMDKYNMTMKGLRTATMITSRGCPNSCTFCGNEKSTPREHDLTDIWGEAIDIKDEGYKAVYVMDDVFTLNKDRSNVIGQILKASKLPFRCTTRANYLDKESVKTLARNGCMTVSMGVESGNDEILQRIGKNQTKSDIIGAQRLLGEQGIDTKGFFIIGLPGETYETARQTIDFAEELRGYGLTSADFYTLTPYPGTAIHKDPNKYGIEIIDKDLSNYLQADHNNIHVTAVPNGMTVEQIKGLIKEGRERWKP